MLKRVLRFVFGRMFICCFLIALELALLTFGIFSLSGGQVYIYWGLHLLSIAVVLYIVSRYDNPSFKMAWVISILSVPIVGGVFYLLFGNKRMSPKIKNRIQIYYNAALEKMDAQSGCEEDLRALNPLLGRQCDYIYNMSGFPIWQNTACDYFPSGEVLFEALVRELKKAEHFIMMEYFIIEEGLVWDPIFRILEEKAAEGVEVMLMYDDMGCIQTLPKGYDQVIASKGILVTVFNPFRPRLNVFMNHRDHRKICVIDGNVGFTGGANLADEYANKKLRFGHWKDTAIMLKGDAVWNLTHMFLHLWEFTNGKHIDFLHYRPTCHYPTDGYIQPFGDSPLDTLNVAENAYMNIINQAKKYVYITTPYLILDNEMFTALITAAQSGIDVRIITPYIPDKWYVHAVTRSFYLPLMESGVQIFEYTPGFIHAKMFVSDDEIAIVGTANMDFRSFYLHFECGVSFYYSSMVTRVKEDILKVQKMSLAASIEEEKNLNWFRRLGRSILKVFSPLM